MYLMIYLLNGSWLPWINIASEFPEFDEKDWLEERLNFRYTHELFQMVPKSLRSTIKKIFILNFEEEPPYDMIIDRLKMELLNNIELGSNMQPKYHCFEWHTCEAQLYKQSILRYDSLLKEENEMEMVPKQA